MSSLQWKFRAVASVAALFLLAGAISCKGFFVNPTLTGITVTCPACASPNSPNITGNGNSLQLLATGNFDDGSSKTLTSSVSWSSADDTQVSVDNTTNKGRATAKTTMTTSGVVITATDGIISGQVSVTVGQTPTTVTCTSCTNGTVFSLATSPIGTTISFTSSAVSNWSSSNTGIMTISGTNSTSASGTLVGGTGTVTITATPTTGSPGSIQITVNQ